MRRSTLVTWLVTLGFSVWLSSRLVDTKPVFAVVVVLTVLLFSAFTVEHPMRNEITRWGG